MVGKTLNHYEITQKLGSGGMGDVYRAQDTKLGRDVAIKILPEVFAHDKELLARFEREARLLASLNHPNIATIHGLEESDEVHFLVLEHVPGETLAERISHGPIPVDEALPLFKQIAEGLEAAHEKGIIHRDLKPANVMVTPEGRPKILDFGLGKALAKEEQAQDLSQSPTMTRDATKTGALLGTAPYMSPEQARGKIVDKRTDIWAFGCCLYEALTGERTFSGDTVADTVSAILAGEVNLDKLDDPIPAPLRELACRCLRTNVNDRLRDIGDARIELQEMPRSAKEAPSSTAKSSSSVRHLLLVAVASVFVTALTAWMLVPRSEPPPVRRLSIPVAGSYGADLALSPDGSQIAYVESRGESGQLFLRSLDKVERLEVPGAVGVMKPFFSPDGNAVGYFSEGGRGALRIISSTDGTVIDVLRATTAYAPGASWGPDGSIYYAEQTGVIKKIRLPVGDPEIVSAKKGQRLFWPHVLPGGRNALVSFWSSEAEAASSVGVLNLITGEAHRLIDDGSYPHYAETGHLVFARGEQLMALPFDPESLRTRGEPVRVLDGVRYFDSWDESSFALSSDGTLVYVPASSGLPSLQPVWVDRSGNMQALNVPALNYGRPRLSPDDSRLAVEVAQLDGDESDIWTMELARGAMSRFTFAGGLQPAWSADGSKLAFSIAGRDGTYNIFWQPSDGGGEPVQLTSNANPTWPLAWFPDGASLLFEEFHPDTERDLGVLSFGASDSVEMILSSAFSEHPAGLSPDGRWLVYGSNETGRSEVYIQTVERTGVKQQVSTNGGTQPLWSRIGHEIYYRDGDRMMVVSVKVDSDRVRLDPPTVLFEGDFVGGLFQFTNYDATRDGERFLMLQLAGGGRSTQEIIVVLNWFEELKHLVPTTK